MVKLANKRTHLSRLSRQIRKQRIGLMGGSFNPAHKAHGEIAEVARKQAKLSEVWWLVSPQNPLKGDKNMMSFDDRLSSALKFTANKPWLKVLDYEYQLQKSSCFPNNRASTIITLSNLCQQFPATSFIWIMGADNLVQFVYWQHAHKIGKLVDICVMNRPEFTYKALASRSISALGTRSSTYNLGGRHKRKWAYSFSTRNTLSATKIRQEKYDE